MSLLTSMSADGFLYDYDLREMPAEALQRFAAYAVVLGEAAHAVLQQRKDGCQQNFDGKDVQACIRGFA
ncbi:hypothetical protein QNM99_17065 [Pseudomonas sp. PCH446]